MPISRDPLRAPQRGPRLPSPVTLLMVLLMLSLLAPAATLLGR